MNHAPPVPKWKVIAGSFSKQLFTALLLCSQFGNFMMEAQ